jgi:putative ABC transport system ATP-binding protein
VAERTDETVSRPYDVTRVYRVEQHRGACAAGRELLGREGEFGADGPLGLGQDDLLNIIGGLDQPTEGDVFSLASRIGKLSDPQAHRVPPPSIGFVFQSFALMPTMSAFRERRASAAAGRHVGVASGANA